MCVTNWKKSLESVKDLKRQNLNKEVLPMLLSGFLDISIIRVFEKSFIFKIYIYMYIITSQGNKNYSPSKILNLYILYKIIQKDNF